MYIIEDFRHAPMRPLATADSLEEAARIVKAMGLTGHACTTARAETVAVAVELLNDRDAQIKLFRDRAISAESERDGARLQAQVAEAAAAEEVKKAKTEKDAAISYASGVADTNRQLRERLDTRKENARLIAENAALRERLGETASEVA